jgi:hypothetical protein
MKRQERGIVPATDLQANVSTRRFKRRSRAAVVLGFVVARSAQIGMSKLSTLQLFPTTSTSPPAFDFDSPTAIWCSQLWVEFGIMNILKGGAMSMARKFAYVFVLVFAAWAATTFGADYQGARVRGRIFLPEGIYYYQIWDGFDGSTKTTGTTRWSISNQYAIYDVGRPMVMNAFGLLARSD